MTQFQLRAGVFLCLLQKQREPLLIKCQPLTLLPCLHPAKAREALDETVAFRARQTGRQTKSLKAFAGSKVAGVNPNSKNPKAAMQFAAFLASTDGQLLRYQVRSAIPVATALAEDPAIASDIVATAILDTIANTSLLQPSLPEMANWWNPIETLGRNIVAGKVTAENGADSLAQTLDLINNPAL